MKVQVIKREIPTEISEQGGANVTIVNKDTVDLETSVEEAKDALVVVGDKLLVKGMFVGLFKSMVKGIERDGNARTLGDFLTLYPVPTGEFDLDTGWNPAVNGVRIRARLMNEMEIDISKWEFEDVTPGRRPFKLESVKAGAVTGVIQLDQAVELNGSNLPTTGAIRVDWAVDGTLLSGTVPGAKVTSTVSRTDIAADALAALNVPANDGKRIELTVRGNFANAKISALLKYVAPLRRISLNTMGATEGATSTAFQMKVVNPDGVRGYATGAGGTSLKADLAVGDAIFADSTLTLGEDGFFRGTAEVASEAGMIATVTLHPDPAKTEFDQNDVTHSEEIAPA